MDNPIDHSIDLGFVNYVQHPTNQSYIVYRFVDAKRATSFEAALVVKEIWFEKDHDEKRGRKYTLFGVHKNDFKKTERINFDVEATHKKPFIPNKIFRYSIMLISGTILTLALIGYCKQQEKLASYDQSDILINDEK
ncbi:MAG: hypothetical protein JKY09_05115 [Crocinitomicaceae bacterium]|nr:hypothetical protein [Crocinitomicaceae bacterium]